MKTTQDFIDALVKVEFIEDSKMFGHYPFQLAAEGKDERLNIGALFLGGDVLSVYRAAKTQIQEGATKLFLSCDFPAVGDIKTDFIAVFTYQGGALSSLAIPYDPQTGVCFEKIINSTAMQMLEADFRKIAMT